MFLGTLHRVRFSLLTIAAMLAIGYVTRYGGLDASMGLAFAKTGKLFAFFSPLLGWLGVALTGSDTSSNALFGSLQKITATQIGISPVLAAASNSSGGVMGKMIDAQSIVVGGVATGQQGHEGNILRYVFFHSIALACLVGVLVLAGVRVPRRGALAAPRTPSGWRTEEGSSRRSLLRPGSVVARWRIPLLGGGPGLLGRVSAVASSGR